MIKVSISPQLGFVAHEKTHVTVTYEKSNIHYETKRNWKTAIHFLNTLLEDKKFINIFQYNEINLWQFYHSYVAADFLYCLELLEIFKKISCVHPESVLTIEIPSDRYQHLTTGLCQVVFPNANIEYIFLATNLIKNVKKVLSQIGVFTFGHALIDKAVRSVRNIPLLFTKSRKLVKPILMVSHGGYTIKSNNGKYYDRVLDAYTFHLKERGHELVGIDCPYVSSLSAAFRFIKRSFNDKNKMRWLCFSSFGDHRDVKPVCISDALKKWAVTAPFPDEIKYAIFFIISTLHKNLFQNIKSYMSSAESIIHHFNPCAVMSAYETGPFARALTIVAKKNSIPTFGVQHGLILGNHTDYMHLKVSDHYNTKGFVISDKTLVWGQFWQNVLCHDGQYPLDNTLISGNHKLTEFDNNSFGGNKGCILFLYVGMTSDEDFERVIHALRAIMPDKKISVKLHPCVKREKLEKFSKLDIEIIQNAPDFYSLIYHSYLCLSDISTAALEMFALNPNGGFVLNFQHLPGWEFLKGFDECYIDSYSMLVESLKLYKNNVIFREKITEKSKKYISDFFNNDNLYRSMDTVISIIGNKQAC